MALPRFKEIENEIRQRIASNALVPGAKLPSEAELMTEFAVSRITVRQALSGLHNAGLIEKVNGKGSFVTRPSDMPSLGALTGFYETGRARGQLAYGKLVSVRMMRAPAFVAAALQLQPGEKVLSVATVRYWDDAPVAHFNLMGPEPLMRRLVQEDLETNDAMSLFESRLGYRFKEVAMEATAVAAPADVARRLGIAVGEPLFRLRSTPYDIENTPLFCGELLFRSDRYAYKWTLTR
ncbi:GntR family transcriptional regulator [Cupriavidus necator]|uniref:GntR family transcriptional regulator n=1 Tax=Cupriavidus necator TaxID=106590 RepID=A0A1U9UZK9_CUPNE|nr:GntR family transcriptional regulator [Cupriavidus necator]AQV98009.1 GntR family transcriptional regulator [Cupriavidus necator]